MTGTLVRLAITVGLLALLAFVVAEPRELLRTLSGVQGPAFLLVLALSAFDRVLMAYKWRLLLRARGVPLRLGTAIRAYFATSFAGLFLPVTLGADAIRILAVRQLGFHDVTASVVIERMLGAVAMLLVALGSCGLLAHEVGEQPLDAIVAWLLVVAAALFAAFLASLWVATRWADAPGRLSRIAPKLAQAYAAYARHPVALTVFLVLSIAESLVPVVLTYTVARGLGFDVSIWLFAATIPISLSIARLPISLGGFGVQEASFVYLSGWLGFNPSDALATMLVADAALVLVLLPAAFDVSMLDLRRRPAGAGPEPQSRA